VVRKEVGLWALCLIDIACLDVVGLDICNVGGSICMGGATRVCCNMVSCSYCFLRL